MVKHQRLDYDIYRHFIKIVNLEIVYVVRKKSVIFEEVKILRILENFNTLCFI